MHYEYIPRDKRTEDRKTIKVLKIMISFLLIFVYLQMSNTLTISPSFGVSLGKPFCVLCIDFSSRYIKPTYNSMIAYKNIDGESVIHKFLREEKNKYVANVSLFEWEDPFMKKDFIGTIFLELKLKTTDNFMKACRTERNNDECNTLYNYYIFYNNKTTS